MVTFQSVQCHQCNQLTHLSFKGLIETGSQSKISIISALKQKYGLKSIKGKDSKSEGNDSTKDLAS